MSLKLEIILHSHQDISRGNIEVARALTGIEQAMDRNINGMAVQGVGVEIRILFFAKAIGLPIAFLEELVEIQIIHGPIGGVPAHDACCLVDPIGVMGNAVVYADESL